METFSALLAISAGNSPVPGEFPTQRPVTWSFDIFLDLRLNKWLSKQSWGWLFETLSRPLWRQCNADQLFSSVEVHVEALTPNYPRLSSDTIQTIRLDVFFHSFSGSFIISNMLLQVRCYWLTRVPFQYPKRRLIVRSHEVSMPRLW